MHVTEHPESDRAVFLYFWWKAAWPIRREAWGRTIYTYMGRTARDIAPC